MNLIVQPVQVREYLELNSPGTSSRYSDDTIGSNLRAAQSYLERECHRYFYDHPGVTWATTTLNVAQLALPGFRSFDSITWGGVAMTISTPLVQTENPSCWGYLEPSEGVPDDSRLVVAIQFRAWRVDNQDRPWYLVDRNWWDKALDSPFFPGNWGGGYAWTSMPNDLIITGDGGYAAGTEPEAVKHVIKVLASWYTMRPASIMGNMANTPGQGGIAYGELPPEVYEFVADWKQGSQVTSVG